MGLLKTIHHTTTKAARHGEDFLHQTQEYYKLKVFQQMVIAMSAFCKVLFIGGLGLLSLVLLTTAGVLALGQATGSYMMACSIMGAVVILMALILYGFRSKITDIVVRKLSKEYFD